MEGLGNYMWTARHSAYGGDFSGRYLLTDETQSNSNQVGIQPLTGTTKLSVVIGSNVPAYVYTFSMVLNGEPSADTTFDAYMTLTNIGTGRHTPGVLRFNDDIVTFTGPTTSFSTTVTLEEGDTDGFDVLNGDFAPIPANGDGYRFPLLPPPVGATFGVKNLDTTVTGGEFRDEPLTISYRVIGFTGVDYSPFDP